MRRALAVVTVLTLLCASIALVGCTTSTPRQDVETLYTSEWIENDMTALVSTPTCGRVEFVQYSSDDWYSVNLKDVTIADGEAYIDSLKKAGYREERRVTEDKRYEVEGDLLIVSLKGKSAKVTVQLMNNTMSITIDRR